MDTTAAKPQASYGGTMATTEIAFLQGELEQRRTRLIDATRENAADASLRQLLGSVDAALARIKAGSYGICEECHESIEADRLLCDPLVRFCLDHLSTEEQRALEKDLALAAGIQRALLPKPDWSLNGWHARYHYQPANVVSGDYCDLIESNGGFLFLLGDVAGKGVAASMLMSHLHATFRTLAGQHLPLRQMMDHANRLFCESTTAGQFATLIVGCASPDGKVEYVSAGHLPLFHLSASGVRSREATGVPLGMFCNAEFHVCELRLAPGDKLLMYTDGLTEMFNSRGDEFGVCGVQALARRHAAATPQGVVDACLEEVRKFAATSKQGDDLTLLVLHRAD
jgi:sigma-B regulation protein RsbU (phosphoserine phosphatase)